MKHTPEELAHLIGDYTYEQARVMLAAPELLKALERITAAIEHNQIAAATLLAEKARAVIKAAKETS